MAPACCVLLTATIDVKHPHYLCQHGRRDTALRLADYEQSLTAWLTRQTTLKQVVVADNSGHPMASLRRIAKQQAGQGIDVEFVSCSSNDDGTDGRSKCELNLIAQAIEKSELIASATHVVKCTGRVFVPNIDRIMQSVAFDADLVATFTRNLTWIESVFFIAQKEVLSERLLPRALQVVDDHAGRCFERAFAVAALSEIATDLRWYPFAREPLLEGWCAFDNTPYPNSRMRGLLIDMATWGVRRYRRDAAHPSQPHPHHEPGVRGA